MVDTAGDITTTIIGDVKVCGRRGGVQDRRMGTDTLKVFLHGCIQGNEGDTRGLGRGVGRV